MQHHFSPWLKSRGADGARDVVGYVIAAHVELARAVYLDAFARRKRARIKVAVGEDLYDGTDANRRNAVWQVVENTPHLDWLIFTRHAGDRISDLSPAKWIRGPRPGENHPGGWPTNLWLGSVFHDQAGADVALDLLSFRPRRRILFCENPTEHIDTSSLFAPWRCSRCGRRGETPRPSECPTGPLCAGARLRPEFDWLILSAPTLGGAAGTEVAEGIGPRLAEATASAGVPFMFYDPMAGGCPPIIGPDGSSAPFEQMPEDDAP